MRRVRAVALVLASFAAIPLPTRSDVGPGAACRIPRRAPAPASLDAARLAWRYFERNYQPATGLVNSVENYPSTTMWDLGSTLLATLAARELDLVSAPVFEQRIAALLSTLERMPLFEGELPNKSYDTATAAMTDYGNHPVAGGIGFSAVDLGRLVSALDALICFHPKYLTDVQRILERWRYCQLVHDHQLYGASRGEDGRIRREQEGRLGYEQYAARALSLIGFRLDRIARTDHFAAEQRVDGVAIPYDTRDPRRYGARNPVLTDPWALDALEFGRDETTSDPLRRIYDVQKRRWQATGVPTAVGEDHVDAPPWFVYDTILEGGVPWRTISPDGADVPGLHALSTKAAFALAALFPEDPYSAVLRDAIAAARAPDRGWYAGIYARGGVNRSLNANTNGVILETVLHEVVGPLHRSCEGCPGHFTWSALLVHAEARRACVPLEGEPDPVARTIMEPPVSATSASLAPAVAGPALGLSGSFFASYREIDGPASGAIATWTPWSHLFLRLGGAVTPLWQGGATRAVWGFGYDDWHENTFSIQVNNWGPIQPYSQDVGPRGAQLDLAYRAPRLCAGPICVATLPFATVPYVGGPYVGARATVTLWEKVFVMGGIGWVIPDVFPPPPGTPRWRPMFGIGFWDWHPGSVFLHYYNWGPSSEPSNGVVTIGMNWAY